MKNINKIYSPIGKRPSAEDSQKSYSLLNRQLKRNRICNNEKRRRIILLLYMYISLTLTWWHLLSSYNLTRTKTNRPVRRGVGSGGSKDPPFLECIWKVPLLKMGIGDEFPALYQRQKLNFYYIKNIYRK